MLLRGKQCSKEMTNMFGTCIKYVNPVKCSNELRCLFPFLMYSSKACMIRKKLFNQN